MRALSPRSRLSAKRNVTVIVRLVVNAWGQLEHGEVVDADAQLQARFVDWPGFVQTMGEWLTQQEQGGAPTREGQEGSKTERESRPQ